MQNIRNVKDPTCVLLLLLLLLLLLRSAAAALPELSCPEHDTKMICDCNNNPQPMMLKPLHGSIYHLEVRNCRNLTVEAHSLHRTENLRKISFQHIQHLVLHKFALSVPRDTSNKALIVEFEQVNFQLIDSHAINGNIEEISFVGGRIEQMQPFGLTTTKDSAILLKLEGVHIQRIESQAFKKFAVEQMIIANCVFGSNVPTRAFYELEVRNELSMQHNRFQELHSHAFSFNRISKLSVSDNRFVGVAGEWLAAHIRDGITLRGNDFGATSDIAFRSLSVHEDYQLSERLELRFHNNTVRSSLPQAAYNNMQPSNEIAALPLHFNERFALSIRELRYNNSWSCEQLMESSSEPGVPRDEFFRLHSEQLLFRQAGGGGGGVAQFVPLRQLIASDCQHRSYVAYIVLGSVLLAVLLVVLLLVIWWRSVQRRKRRKLDVVQPEPRTYKETQIVYQIENAGLLKTDL
ncbi:CG5541 [Drosophila busckii]|uniref:CG5541 n=1 Tax=Drosophila busckii TaxID=30019 RepID=A0A0M4EST9_DROBS|nr:uncharacterized protein LOC108606044 [Drosophila busckii]XP_017851381.1 uncharacterized protein LOC108606044 [Drosophila busckii]ALC49440.1 CG5541 [Drosophila busckii]